MGIDLESQDGRTSYLSEKLDNLLSGINASYGQKLLDELVTRLERTIIDFNHEVEGIMDDLKDNSERRNQIIHDLMEGKDYSPEKETPAEEPKRDTEGMSEWEKRLEGM